MVTAAVCWDLLKKQSLNLSFLFILQHRAGVRPYTSFFNLAESCVFIKQSLPPILLHLSKLNTTITIMLNFVKYSFSRSYRVILPSSFNIVISYALVFSTNSPVSDLIRSNYFLFKFFLGKIKQKVDSGQWIFSSFFDFSSL